MISVQGKADTYVIKKGVGGKGGKDKGPQRLKSLRVSGV